MNLNYSWLRKAIHVKNQCGPKFWVSEDQGTFGFFRLKKIEAVYIFGTQLNKINIF